MFPYSASNDSSYFYRLAAIAVHEAHNNDPHRLAAIAVHEAHDNDPYRLAAIAAHEAHNNDPYTAAAIAASRTDGATVSNDPDLDAAIAVSLGRKPPESPPAMHESAESAHSAALPRLALSRSNSETALHNHGGIVITAARARMQSPPPNLPATPPPQQPRAVAPRPQPAAPPPNLSATPPPQQPRAAIPRPQPVPQAARDADDDEDFIPEPYLLTNPLSWFWKPQGRAFFEEPGHSSVAPIVYAWGMIGYAIALSFRVVEVALRAIRLLIACFTYLQKMGSVTSQQNLRLWTKVFVAKVAEVGVGVVGLLCPRFAYTLDEHIQKDREVHNRSYTSWEGNPNGAIRNNPKAIQNQSRGLTSMIVEASRILKGVYCDHAAEATDLHNQTALSFAIAIVNGRADELKKNPFGLNSIRNGAACIEALEKASAEWQRLSVLLTKEGVIESLALDLTTTSFNTLHRLWTADADDAIRYRGFADQEDREKVLAQKTERDLKMANMEIDTIPIPGLRTCYTAFRESVEKLAQIFSTQNPGPFSAFNNLPPDPVV